MKFIKPRKLLTIILATCVFISNFSFVSNTVFANSVNNVITEKTNFIILKNISGHIEYTYDENGSSYKVVEQISPDFNRATSQIYQKDGQGRYILDSKILTTRKNDNLEIITTKNQRTNIENISISKAVRIKKDDNSASTLIQSKNSINSDVPPLTSWQYNGTFEFSTRVTRYTIAAVALLIGGIVAVYTGPITGAATNTIGGIAAIVITDQIPLIYYTQYVYYKFIQGTLLPRAELSITYVYGNSQRSNRLGVVTNETYASGFEP